MLCSITIHYAEGFSTGLSGSFDRSNFHWFEITKVSEGFSTGPRGSFDRSNYPLDRILRKRIEGFSKASTCIYIRASKLSPNMHLLVIRVSRDLLSPKIDYLT